MQEWSVYLTDYNGLRLADMSDNHGFEFLRVANNVGAFNINLAEDFDDSLLAQSYRVEFWRNFAGKSALLFTGLVDRWFLEGQQGDLRVDGKCVNHLLDRRVIIREYTGVSIDGYIAVGRDSANKATFWSSPDGVVWTKQQTTATVNDSGKSCIGAETGDGIATVQVGAASLEFWKSTDGGATWVQKDTYAVPSNSDEMLLADNGNLIDSAGDEWLLSTDDGENWAVTDSTGTATDSIRSLAKCPSTGYLYAGITTSGAFGEVWRSTDHGVNWTQRGVLLINAVLQIGVASDGTVIKVDNQPWTEYSTDGGATWNIGTNLNGNGEAMVTMSDGTVILGTSGPTETWKSVNNGQSFTRISAAVGCGNMVEAGGSSIILGTVGATILRSTDQGVNWSTVATEAGGAMNAVAVLYA